MLVYKMNQLLLLGGLVLALYVMNEKKMFSGLSKTLSSGKNNTMLVLVFCGVILFMCMQKGKVMEYFSLLEGENNNNCGPNKKKMHIYDPDSDAAHTPICIERDSELDRLGLVMVDENNTGGGMGDSNTGASGGVSINESIDEPIDGPTDKPDEDSPEPSR